jgi:hypothetical protein
MLPLLLLLLLLIRIWSVPEAAVFVAGHLQVRFRPHLPWTRRATLPCLVVMHFVRDAADGRLKVGRVVGQ